MKHLKKIKNIKLLLLDVDGVLTDTRIFLDSDGEWKRFFSIRDGVGIKELHARGYQTAVITGSKSRDIAERMKVLGITYFYEGYLDKMPAFKDLLEKSSRTIHEIAFIGDDIYDIPVMERVAYTATVPEAIDEVKDIVDYVTVRQGGLGAVREICDQLIQFGFYSREGTECE